MLPLLLALVLAQPGPAPSVQFERGRVAFERGQWARAIEQLRPLLYPDLRLMSEAQVTQAHRMLGHAYVFQRQNDLAAQEFRKLLQLRPDWRFDTLLDPPEVVDLFNNVLREQEGELAAIEARRREAVLRAKREREARERVRLVPTIVEKPVLRNSLAVSFIPFGAGQFQNGQRRKGWAFLGTEAVLAATSIGAFAANFAIYGVNPKRPCNGPPATTTGQCPRARADQDRSELLTQVQVVSGGLFFAVAAWGVADALVNYRPTSPLAAAPVLLEDGAGAGLAFRF